MPYKPQARCPECLTLHSGTGRCNTCRQSDKHARRPEMRADQARRADVVAAWREQYGDWCPGWGRPAHEASDLTADHVQAVAAGGAERGPLGVLCTRCNSAKAHRT